MGAIYSILTAVLLTLSGQDGVPYAEIDAAFEANNASKITLLANNKVLLNVLGKESAYSTSQAKLVLQDFFTKKPNGEFAFIFKGKDSDHGSFAIGNYTTKKEEFRVTLHFKKSGKNYILESLSIEKG